MADPAVPSGPGGDVGARVDTGLRLVLASGSPRRAELLARLGVIPEIRPSDIDETPRPGEPVVELVTRLAAAKVAAVEREDDAVVLAADTVVALDGLLLGKPRDRDDARQMLTALSGQTHQVVTGVVVRRGEAHRIDHVVTDVTFRVLSDEDIGWYIATGEPDDKAGAYGLQGAGAVLVDRIEGSDTNVIGLPLPATLALLRQVGLDPLRASDPR